MSFTVYGFYADFHWVLFIDVLFLKGSIFAMEGVTFDVSASNVPETYLFATLK
jgi:hypothetical protein